MREEFSSSWKFQFENGNTYNSKTDLNHTDQYYYNTMTRKKAASRAGKAKEAQATGGATANPNEGPPVEEPAEIKKKPAKRKKGDGWSNHSKAWKKLVHWLKMKKIPVESQGRDEDMALYHLSKDFEKYDKDKWLDRLEKCREVVRKKQRRSTKDEEMLKTFRGRNKPEKRMHHDMNGDALWTGEAKEQFDEDIANKVDDEYETWEDYKQSKPDLYKNISAERMRWRKGQLKRAKKFNNWAEGQTKKKLKKMGLDEHGEEIESDAK